MPIAHHEKRVYKNRGVVITPALSSGFIDNGRRDSRSAGVTLAPSYETLERESLEAVEPRWPRYPKTRRLWDVLLNDPEARANWDMADYMAVNKLNYNDHGMTHAIIAGTNAIRIFDLLVQAGVAPDVVSSARATRMTPVW